MRDSPFRSAVDGNREFGCPVGREEGAYTDQLVSMLFSHSRFIDNTYHRALRPLLLKTITQAEVDSLSYQNTQKSTPTFNPHSSIILLATGRVIIRIVQRQRPSKRRLRIRSYTLPRCIYIQPHRFVHIHTCPRDWLMLIGRPRKFKHTLLATCRSQITPAVTGRKSSFPPADLRDRIQIKL